MLKPICSLILMATLVAGSLLTFSGPVLAQEAAQEQACIGAGGEWRNGQCIRDGETSDIVQIINTIANILLLLIGAVAVLMLIIGGFRYVFSGGDANAVEGAKNTILYAVIGIVVAFLSYAAVNFVISRLTGTQDGDNQNQQQNSPGQGDGN